MRDFVTFRLGPKLSPIGRVNVTSSSIFTELAKIAGMGDVMRERTLARVTPYLSVDAGHAVSFASKSVKNKVRFKFAKSPLGISVLRLLSTYVPSRTRLPALFLGLAEKESDFNPSLQSSESSAFGAIQIIKESWKVSTQKALSLMSSIGLRPYSVLKATYPSSTMDQAVATLGVLIQLEDNVRRKWRWNGSTWAPVSPSPASQKLSQMYSRLLADELTGFYLLASFFHTNGMNKTGPKISYVNKLGDYAVACLASAWDVATKQFGDPVDDESVKPVVSTPAGKVTVISGYKWRKFKMRDGSIRNRFHYGMDLRAPVGVPVLSPFDGTITEVATKNGWGRTVVVTAASGKEAFRFAHLSRFDVKKGDRVLQGQRIGLTGSSDFSVKGGLNEDGVDPHLHIEWYKNPNSTHGKAGSDLATDGRQLYKRVLPS